MFLATIGGGQLGRYILKSAKAQGINTLAVDPLKNASAFKYADIKCAKAYDSIEALNTIINNHCYVTYEFENVSFEAISYLVKNGVRVLQGAKPLRISQDRLLEKSAAASTGISTCKYVGFNSLEEFLVLSMDFNYPYIIKTTRDGYDGHGQFRIKSDEDKAKFIEEFKPNTYIIEDFVNFKMECSCIAVRDAYDNIVCFDAFENEHYNGILNITISPARISNELNEKIKETTIKFVEKMNFYGILTIEYFIGENDEIIFNEMAPRPHNSGHITMDNYDYSQYDLLVNSVTYKNVVTPKLKSCGVMVNILGQDMPLIEGYSNPKAKVYLYDKQEARLNRKMGHINFTGDNIDELLKLAKGVINRG